MPTRRSRALFGCLLPPAALLLLLATPLVSPVTLRLGAHCFFAGSCLGNRILQVPLGPGSRAVPIDESDMNWPRAIESGPYPGNGRIIAVRPLRLIILWW